MGRGEDAGRNVAAGDSKSDMTTPHSSPRRIAARDQNGQRGVAHDNRTEHRCLNCGLAISWPSIIVNGMEYCCGGCALGGPCYCSYDAAGSEEPIEDPVNRVDGPRRSIQWER